LDRFCDRYISTKSNLSVLWNCLSYTYNVSTYSVT
jgi:hypothetical protein